MADETEISDILKNVLQKEYGIDLESLQSKIAEYEDKEENRAEKTITIANANLEKLNKILQCDGIIGNDTTATEVDISKWVDSTIEDTYEDYDASQRFNETPQDDV